MNKQSGKDSLGGSEPQYSHYPSSNSSIKNETNPFEDELQEYSEPKNYPKPNPQLSSDTDILTLHSMALSEAETFTRDQVNSEQLSLPRTYQENFKTYAPCILRRFYGVRSFNGYAENPDNTTTFASGSELGNEVDDDRTMISNKKVLSIMGRETTDYEHLRTLVIAGDVIKSNMYVFPDSESLEMFRNLRKSKKKEQKNSKLSKEKSGDQSEEPLLAFDEDTQSGSLSLDSFLQNFIGVEQCLPLLKIEVPFLSSLRPNTPFMKFRQYFGSQSSVGSQSVGCRLINIRDFCTVRLKSFQDYKRYTFIFQPEVGDQFTLLAFQHNYRPFTDFNYKGTRFRVFGTSRTASYPTFYNPELKLQVLDNDQPSLMDDLIQKKAKMDYFKKKDSLETENLTDGTLQNPVPSPGNPILKQLRDEENSSFYRNNVPRDMPPFGKFLDASAYMKKKSFIPKLFSEIGKIAVYEDPLEISNSPNSAVHLDTLVLTTIFLAFRENSIRSTVKRDDITVF